MNYELRSILCASDLAENAPAVLRHAFGLAGRFGAQLHVVTVALPWNPLPYEEFISPDCVTQMMHAGRRRAELALRQQVDDFVRNHPDIGEAVASVGALEGEPWRCILGHAKHVLADVIVLGSRGHSALGEPWLGSVAHRVVAQADVPVMLVPIEH